MGQLCLETELAAFLSDTGRLYVDKFSSAITGDVELVDARRADMRSTMWSRCGVAGTIHLPTCNYFVDLATFPSRPQSLLPQNANVCETSSRLSSTNLSELADWLDLILGRSMDTSYTRADYLIYLGKWAGQCSPGQVWFDIARPGWFASTSARSGPLPSKFGRDE